MDAGPNFEAPELQCYEDKVGKPGGSNCHIVPAERLNDPNFCVQSQNQVEGRERQEYTNQWYRAIGSFFRVHEIRLDPRRRWE